MTVMTLSRNKLMKESEMDDIQKRWKASQHPINNPKGYGYPDILTNPNILDQEFKTARLLDLEKLIQIIYDDLKSRSEYYESGKKSNHDAFIKYVNKCVMLPFPYPQDKEAAEVIKVTRVQWVQSQRSYSIITNNSNNYTEFCELRFNKLLPLAKICNFIDQIQVDDYRKNKITIDLIGDLNGNINRLVYGKKHALSAYLGQWIIRLFPFKDYTGFVSEKHDVQKRSDKETIYEHFTPMTFFRDLIWFKGKSDDQYIFDWKNLEHRAYNVEEWLSILWYRYRTVSILKCEDKELTDKGEKSRRSEGDIAYDKAGIKIHSSMSSAWDEVHKIERLKKIIL